MTPEQLFSITNLVAMAGWLILVLAPRSRWGQKAVSAIPPLLSLAYLALLIAHWGEGTGNFSTLAGVASLFTNQWLLLAGWVHYLAFDLFVGIWEARDAAERNISHWFLIPILALTFFFGPVGFLAYLSLRQMKQLT